MLGGKQYFIDPALDKIVYVCEDDEGFFYFKSNSVASGSSMTCNYYDDYFYQNPKSTPRSALFQKQIGLKREDEVQAEGADEAPKKKKTVQEQSGIPKRVWRSEEEIRAGVRKENPQFFTVSTRHIVKQCRPFKEKLGISMSCTEEYRCPTPIKDVTGARKLLGNHATIHFNEQRSAKLQADSLESAAQTEVQEDQRS
jgi:hypothetical protein